jgi:U4/U6 small nuclear ribonucleoprotein PRP31
VCRLASSGLVQIEEDAYQDAVGFSFGAIGKSGSGKVRAAQVDSKTKAKISQKLQVSRRVRLGSAHSALENVATTEQHVRRNDDRAQQKTDQWHSVECGLHAAAGRTAPVGPMARSSACVQGLEIVNPNAAEKDKTGIDSEKYFSNSFGFTKISPSVIPKTS